VRVGRDRWNRPNLVLALARTATFVTADNTIFPSSTADLTVDEAALPPKADTGSAFALVC